MKKIITILAGALFSLTVSAQQVSITIDSVWYTPSAPVAGNDIFLNVRGSANCTVQQQGSTFISDTRRMHTLSVCLMGDPQMPPMNNFNLTYNVYHANTAGQDTLVYMFFYNKHDTMFCDTVLTDGEFIIPVGPSAIFSNQSPSFDVSWNQYTSSLTVSKLQTKAEFSLMDMSGRMIHRQQLSGETEEIKIAGVREGVYLVRISDNEGILYRKKIFIPE